MSMMVAQLGAIASKARHSSVKFVSKPAGGANHLEIDQSGKKQIAERPGTGEKQALRPLICRLPVPDKLRHYHEESPLF
jgi:hypothetical protein